MHINHYHENPSLLFQFILAEFLTLNPDSANKLRNYLALLHTPKKTTLALQQLAQELCSEKHTDKIITKMTKHMLDLIHHFSDDENILFFLLRNHVQCQKLFGKQTIVKLLKDSQKLLTQRYHKRKFDHLIPEINNLFAQL